MGGTPGRMAVALLWGAVAWFMTLVVIASAAINYDEYLGYRMNVLGRSYPPWPGWTPWWGWYLMHALAVVVGLLFAVLQWLPSLPPQDAAPGTSGESEAP